jgi:hypothetical protein
MTINELVNALYKNNLNAFTFGVYYFNHKYTMSLKGSYPEEYAPLLGFIGGNSNINYTKKEIEDEIIEMQVCSVCYINKEELKK